MNKHAIVLISAGAVVVVLLAVTGFFLFANVQRFSLAQGELQTAEAALASFYQNNPFPARENLEVRKSNLGQLNEQYAKLESSLMGEGLKQDEGDSRSPSLFMNRLISNRDKLRQAAATRRIKLVGDGFAFGFEKYATGGVPPAPDHVPRLMRQLNLASRISALLLTGNISAIAVMERDVFEDAKMEAAPVPNARGRRSRRGEDAAPAPAVAAPASSGRPPNDLYDIEHFKIEVDAHEEAVLGVLNRLGTFQPFTIVTRVEFTHSQPTVSKAPQARARSDETSAEDAADESAPAAEKTEAVPRRDERVVSGKPVVKPGRLALEMDVFLFKQEQGKQVQEAKP